MINFIDKYFIFGDITVASFNLLILFVFFCFIVGLLINLYVEPKRSSPNYIYGFLSVLWGLFLIWLFMGESTKWSLYIKNLLNTKL
jgi:hypothetical protein